MQKLTINNFGPISKVEVLVKDLIIIIGPQASGKSTISKSIYFFKSLKDDLVKMIFESVEENTILKEPTTTLKKKIRAKFVSFWGTTKHLKQFKIEYFYGRSKTVKLFLDKGYVKADFSVPFHNELNKIFNDTELYITKQRSVNKSFSTASERITSDSEKKAFYRQIEKSVNLLFEDEREAFYIPAGRSLISTLSGPLELMLHKSISSSIGETNGDLDPYLLDFSLKAFIERIGNLRNAYSLDFETIIKDKGKFTNESVDNESLKIAIDIFDRILKGRYRFDKDGEKLFINNSDEFVKLSLASSGQQEVVWILLQIFPLILNRTKVFLVIEEPEAHLFPVAQKDIVELLCLLSNLNTNQIIITTHSPYILSSLNNFIYAGKLGITKASEVAKYVNKKTWIKSEKVSAFYIENGILANIIDEELQLIKVEEIDKASYIINEQFNHLFDLDIA
jgi:predicted ATPase